MKTLAILLTCVLGSAATAQAQAIYPLDSLGYVQGNLQSAFGNVTSQSFGAEAGVNIRPDIQVFVEGGQVRDSSPGELGEAATLIANALGQTQNSVTYRVRQPVTFGLIGGKYLVMTEASRINPYVMVGGGIARVKKKVTFAIGGEDVTDNLGDFGVVLGTDLSGSETKGMFSAGVGINWAWRRILVDLQYRYGRVLTDDSLSVSRAGLGIGVFF